MSIKSVIFDMDGVILDSEPMHDIASGNVLRDFGVEPSHDLFNPFVGASSDTLWRAMKEKFGLEASVDELLDKQWSNVIAVLRGSQAPASRGLLELLEYLRDKDIHISVASSSRRDFIDEVFEKLGISSYIEQVTSGFEVSHGKPAPDVFLLAASKIGVEPKNTLVVEDSTNGVAAALAAEMFTVGYINPTSVGQSVSRANRTVDCLSDIIAIVDELNR